MEFLMDLQIKFLQLCYFRKYVCKRKEKKILSQNTSMQLG